MLDKLIKIASRRRSIGEELSTSNTRLIQPSRRKKLIVDRRKLAKKQKTIIIKLCNYNHSAESNKDNDHWTAWKQLSNTIDAVYASSSSEAANGQSVIDSQEDLQGEPIGTPNFKSNFCKKCSFILFEIFTDGTTRERKLVEHIFNVLTIF